MFKQLKTSQFNADDQDTNSSSTSDSLDQGSGQFSFDPSNPFGGDTQEWGPRVFLADTNVQMPWSWGASFTPPPSAASWSSPGAPATASSDSATASATSDATYTGGSTLVTNGSALQFSNTYGASCTSAYIACIVAAEKQLESLFTTYNGNTDTIVVTFNESDEGNNGDALGNSSNGYLYSYSTVKSALQTAAPSDVLPSTDPSGGSTQWYVPEAYGRMLGLTSTTGSPDLSVSLNTYYSWDFGQDVINGLTHELSEGGLGRIGGLGGNGSQYWGTMDLFRYNGSDVPDYTNGRDGDTTYFDDAYNGNSLSDANLPNKGAPTLSYNNQYNSNGTFNNGGDTADWVQNQVFGSTGDGETLGLTQTELDVMRSLGWTLSLKQDVDGTAATGNSWETPTDWSTGSMPIEAQDAYITGAGVTLDSNVIVNSIGTSSGGILEIGDSSATRVVAVDGTTLNSLTTSYTGTGNNGDTLVYDGSSLQIGYFDVTYTNAGTLGVGDKGAGGTGYLYLASEVEFNGGGDVVLGAGSGYYGDILNASGVNGDLVNDNNTFEGNGLISLYSITNSGVIKASTGTLTVSTTSGTDDSSGWLEATSGGRLELESVVSGSGGYVYAGSGGTVDIWSSVGAGIDAYVAYGGVENVESGGSTNYGVVYGSATTSAGAFDSSTYIESGGVQYVYGSSYYGAIELYGNQYVESGGEAYGTVDYWNQFVSAGAVTYYVSALSEGDQYVSSGATAEYTTLSAGGQQWVYSGGLGWEALVYSGGDQEVEPGGTADYTQVYAGGVQHNYGSSYGADVYGSAIVYSGGIDSATYIGSTGNEYISSGGFAYGSYDYWNQFVYAGGVTSYTSALSAGDQYVSSGGTADYTVLSAGGQQWIYTGGLGYEAFVYSGGDQEVEPGGTADYTQVYAGGAQHDYGSSYGASIYSGGVAYTYAGGVDSSTYIGSGGVQSVYGSSYSATIASGGSQTVEYGGFTVSSYVSDPGGIQYVSSGGLAEYTYDAWDQYVYAGADAYYTSVYYDGYQLVYGFAYDTVVYGVGPGGFHATQFVYSGGEADVTYVDSGGIEDVESGGVAYYTYVYSGGTQNVILGGSSYYGIVYSGGVEYDYGLASGGAVSSGGNEYVESGGVDSSTTILQAGKQTVYAGGSAYYDTVSSGGTQYDSGFAFSTTIVKGGIQNVLSGGYEEYSTVYGVENVSSGGGAYYDTVESGATEQVHGFAYDVSILLGGVQNISAGASEDYSQVWGVDHIFAGGSGYGETAYAGGKLYVSGGFDSFSTILSGGQEYVRSGGAVTSVFVSSGGQLYVSSGSVDSAAILLTYGHETVYHGGAAYYDDVSATGATLADLGLTFGATVMVGGVENVSAGGVEQFSQLYGAEHISSGGKGYDETVDAGGQLYVYSGGVNSSSFVYGNEFLSGGSGYGDTIYSGGKEYVRSGGVASATIVSSGGFAVVSSGSLIKGATVMSGGTLTVSSGGVASAGLTLSGGTANISGSTLNPMSFSGPGGDLALYNLGGFGSTIGGFSTGDEFDLGGFGYSAGETETFQENGAHTQGLLTVTDGAQVAKLTLLGTYTSSEFALSNDLHGGTFVKYV